MKSGLPPAISRPLNVLRIVLLNAAFYPLLVIFTILVIVVGTMCLVPLMPFSSRREHQRKLRYIIHFYGTGAIRVLPFPWVRVVYEAEEELDRDRTYIFIANHRAACDAFLMACQPIRESIQVVNVWPMKLPVYGYYAKVAGYLSVLEMPVDLFLSAATERLKERVSIVIFPEGHRSGSREMLPFHSAGFRLAQKANVPLVPLCLSGTENILPKGSRFLHPGRIRIRQLKPIEPEYWEDMNPTCLKLRVRKMIHDELERMEAED